MGDHITISEKILAAVITFSTAITGTVVGWIVYVTRLGGRVRSLEKVVEKDPVPNAHCVAIRNDCERFNKQVTLNLERSIENLTKVLENEIKDRKERDEKILSKLDEIKKL